jgi:hypothetical protein
MQLSDTTYAELHPRPRHDNPHCGQCSQCIDRRFAVLAAGQEDEDPAEAYQIDLLLGERQVGPDREMALSFVRSASAVNRMTNIAFFTRYGETSRIVGFFQEPSDTVAERIFGLYRRHAVAVCRVFDKAITTNASKLGEGSLHAESLLSLVVGQRGEDGGYRVPSSALNRLFRRIRKFEWLLMKTAGMSYSTRGARLRGRVLS